MNKKRILLSGLVVWLVNSVWGAVTCGWLFNWVYKIQPVIWKTNEAIMAPSNAVGMHVGGLIAALLFAYVYALLYKSIPGQGVKKGMMYGVLVWLVGALPGIGMMPFYMTIAPTVVVYMIINVLVGSVLIGAVVGWIYKR